MRFVIDEEESLDITDLSLQVAEYEATTFSIFYNNSLFLALVIIASFYVLSVSPSLGPASVTTLHFRGPRPT